MSSFASSASTISDSTNMIQSNNEKSSSAQTGDDSTSTGTEIVAECEKCVDEMKTSLKPYNRHLILCLPQGVNPFLDSSDDVNWPSHIEEIPIVKYFNDTKGKYENDIIKLKLTACDFNPSVNVTSDDVYDTSISIILYPENVIITIPFNSSVVESDYVEKLFQWCYSMQPGADSVTSTTSLRERYKDTSVVINDTSWDKLILVCIHMARDKRCGRAGPLILSELKKQLESSDSSASNRIQICGSSHIGGHKYAGVLIVYPENQWYGRISKATITKLLNVLLHRDVNEEDTSGFMEKCHRGSGYCSNNVSELF